MIEAEVKWIDWYDEFAGSVDEPDMLSITAGVGERGSEGADNFQVEVCNLAWLAGRLDEKPGFWPRGMLIVRKINTKHVENALQKLVQQFNGSQTWPIFTERLNRYLHWEYEDMDDYQGLPEVPDFK